MFNKSETDPGRETVLEGLTSKTRGALLERIEGDARFRVAGCHVFSTELDESGRPKSEILPIGYVGPAHASLVNLDISHLGPYQETLRGVYQPPASPQPGDVEHTI